MTEIHFQLFDEMQQTREELVKNNDEPKKDRKTLFQDAKPKSKKDSRESCSNKTAMPNTRPDQDKPEDLDTPKPPSYLEFNDINIPLPYTQALLELRMTCELKVPKIESYEAKPTLTTTWITSDTPWRPGCKLGHLLLHLPYNSQGPCHQLF